MNAAITGVGTSFFGKQQDLHPNELIWRAVAEALEDADHPRIDAIYLGTVFGAPGVAQRALHQMGLTGMPIITVENACASGTTAFHEAAKIVELGRSKRSGRRRREDDRQLRRRHPSRVDRSGGALGSRPPQLVRPRSDPVPGNPRPHRRRLGARVGQEPRPRCAQRSSSASDPAHHRRSAFLSDDCRPTHAASVLPDRRWRSRSGACRQRRQPPERSSSALRYSGPVGCGTTVAQTSGDLIL